MRGWPRFNALHSRRDTLTKSHAGSRAECASEINAILKKALELRKEGSKGKPWALARTAATIGEGVEVLS